MMVASSFLLILFPIFLLTFSLKRNRFDKHSYFIRDKSSLFCSSVAIFDDVLDAALCEIIDNSVKLGGLGHAVFKRNKTHKTAPEVAIHSILTTLNDISPIVEYWWREEWLNLELHRDVDEKLAQQLENNPESFHYPNHAHVLYLSIGNEVQGSTIILQDSSCLNSSSQFDGITIVPAVNGRLLRFNGNLMHSTPRPALAYLDPSEGGSNLELWTRKRPVDKNDPEYNIFRRSVLLFNTWSHEPMSDIPLIDSDNINAYQQLHEVNVNTNEKITKSLSNLVWKKRVISEKSNNEKGSSDNKIRRIRLKLGILGDAKRRERANRYLNLYASSAIKEALTSEERLPTQFKVSEVF
jgi:hypothetical protein